MSKDQIIRGIAYAIWEAEGRPDGQAEDHWARAEMRINEQPLERPADAPVVKKSRPKKAPIVDKDTVIRIGEG